MNTISVSCSDPRDSRALYGPSRKESESSCRDNFGDKVDSAIEWSGHAIGSGLKKTATLAEHVISNAVKFTLAPVCEGTRVAVRTADEASVKGYYEIDGASNLKESMCAAGYMGIAASPVVGGAAAFIGAKILLGMGFMGSLGTAVAVGCMAPGALTAAGSMVCGGLKGAWGMIKKAAELGENIKNKTENLTGKHIGSLVKAATTIGAGVAAAPIGAAIGAVKETGKFLGKVHDDIYAERSYIKNSSTYEKLEIARPISAIVTGAAGIAGAAVFETAAIAAGAGLIGILPALAVGGVCMGAAATGLNALRTIPHSMKVLAQEFRDEYLSDRCVKE